jgi:AraC-like DNA-binding protein
MNSLETLMQEQRLYLDAAINIDGLATMVGSNRHHLSQVLNERLKKSFYDYINHFRIEEAKVLLADPGRSKHKIASIAYDAGFNSLSTFNDVFRKSTGLTPSQFRKQPVEISHKKRV